MEDLDHRESRLQDASAQPERSERAPLPESNRNVITDAERAANPIGTAKREREMARDREGKFARPKQDDHKPDGKGDRQQDHDGGDAEHGERQDRQQVPTGALRAERDKRQQSEREADQLRREVAELRGMVMGRQQPGQQPQQPAAPQFWEDPNAAMDHRVREAMSPVMQTLQAERLQRSQMFAMQVHGEQRVSEAVQALADLRSRNPAEYGRLEAMADRSADPVGDVVRWHKQQVAMREIGDDPAAYRERLRQELIAEIQGREPGDHHQQHAQPAAQRPPVQRQPLPTSFAAQPGGGPRGGPAYAGPRPLSEIMPRG